MAGNTQTGELPTVVELLHYIECWTHELHEMTSDLGAS